MESKSVEADPGKLSAFPNPFNPATAISFQLLSVSDVTLAAYDLLGREVAALFKGRLGAGVHTVRWDASPLSCGVYFIRLNASPCPGGISHVEMTKVCLIK